MKVVICIPTLRKPHAATLEAIRAAVPVLDEAGIEHGLVSEVGNPYISQARNVMLRKALDAKANAVIFLDHDVSFQSDALLQLLLVPDDVVTMHTRCTYIDEVTGTQREIELVYPDEADPARGRISVLTPVGSALLGLRVGQEIAWNFPDGSVRCLKIASVNRSPR